jgi:hypothetical protein
VKAKQQDMTGQKLLLISACIQKWETFCIQKMIMKNKISSVLLSADTISHRVRNASGEIKLIFGEYIMLSMNFSLQNDKSIDIGGHTQLTSGIWEYHHKQLLFLQQPLTNFVLLSENRLQWNACRDVAFSDGKVTCFIANLKEVNPKIRSHHLLVYHNANDAKIPPAVFKNVLKS